MIFGLVEFTQTDLRNHPDNNGHIIIGRSSPRKAVDVFHDGFENYLGII